MTNPPPTKSPPSAPSWAYSADTTQDTTAVVRPKDDAEGVLSALPCTVLTEDEANAATAQRVIGGLEIKMPYRRTPTARSWCECGRDITARGDAEVRALIDGHAYHRTVCHLHHIPERRNAA